MTSWGTALARLGGANPTLLQRVPTEKGKFVQMGLVLLSTAGLAVASMSFALVDGLDAGWWLALPAGLVWGFIILNLDRLLIQNIRPMAGVWRTLAMILPRLAVAALLGAVIATPLVLRVFHSEIEAEMQRENARKANELGITRAAGPTAKRLEEVNTKISTNEGILAGNVPGLTSPNLETAKQAMATAQSNLDSKRKAANEAYDAMRCELDGERCSGGSGKRGPGPRYDALKRLYNIAAADLKTAQEAVAKAQKDLDAANAEAREANKSKVEEAQATARTELPGLYAERRELQAKVGGQREEDDRVQEESTGMLARIEALGRIGDQSPSAARAHWAVALLLFMIELLPVLVKLLTSMGPPSVYDRVSAMEDDSAFDRATLHRNAERRRIEGESKKQRDIEDDMRAKETALGVKANAHVAHEMERILDVALQQWSTEVEQTLNAARPSEVDAQVRDAKPVDQMEYVIRSNYKLPPAGNL